MLVLEEGEDQEAEEQGLLGLEFGSGPGDGSAPIVLTALGPRHADGQLRLGMRLLKVNGVAVADRPLLPVRSQQSTTPP